uniref:Uncharacterized protein n=1 Tax=Ananas comosus var. bracteatus TaxID=296719 RepID=A0A6V7NPZ3_ANACO|nr:unnamed protein product [Ananas comosus var. bracteatus]
MRCRRRRQRRKEKERMRRAERARESSSSETVEERTWATGDKETTMMEVHETGGETRRRRRRRRGSVCQNVNAKVPSANKASTYPSERALSSLPFHLPIEEPQSMLCARGFAASFDDDSVLL